MDRFKTVEEIKAYFVGAGWNKEISFRELTVEEAQERGFTFILPRMENNCKFFVMNDTGNVYDDRGTVVLYNITTGDEAINMDIDEAMHLLHCSHISFSYDVDPPGYSIRQKDLPKLFKYVVRSKVNELILSKEIKCDEERKKNLAHNIMELFENLLDEKEIEIPCADETEQRDRYEGGNSAKLYGMEYWNLIDTIQTML